MSLESIIKDLNGYLRANRVPRKAAAIHSAICRRESIILSQVFDGKRRLPTAESLLKNRNTAFAARNISADLRALGLSDVSIGEVLRTIAYEVAAKDIDTSAWVEDLVGEAIRDAFVARQVIDEHQYVEGCKEKFSKI